MNGYFEAHEEARLKYLERSINDRTAYFDRVYPKELRSHLMLLTLDFNPYYATISNKAKMNQWADLWIKLRRDMLNIKDLKWLSITSALDEQHVDDFVDLGHMTIPGQKVLANNVANYITNNTNWLNN